MSEQTNVIYREVGKLLVEKGFLVDVPIELAISDLANIIADMINITENHLQAEMYAVAVCMLSRRYYQMMEQKVAEADKK